MYRDGPNIYHVHFVYYYKFLVIMIFECSVHASDGFPKNKVWMGGVGEWDELYPFFFYRFLELS